jgi:hypothetical protein
MAQTVHILATCTDRKRGEVPPELRLRSVHAATVAARAALWWKRLDGSRSGPVVARDLYSGDHWAVARGLPEVAEQSGLKAHLWVISAGYGLISADAEVRPYSATFVRRHADSVWIAPEARSGTDSSDWWSALSRCGGSKTPRSVQDLVRDHPRDRFLIVAAPDYVEALEPDIIAATSQLSDSARLLVVSSRGSSRSGPLAEHLVVSDARLQAKLGGAKGSLNARVARRILMDAPRQGLEASDVRTRLESLIAQCPELETYDRTKLTDEDVITFVQRELKREPRPSCTTLLRALRESGRACEQHRFKALYHKTVEETHVRT